MVFCGHFFFSSQRSRVTRAFRSRENGPEAETAARWHRVAKVIRPFERSTAVCYWCSVEISRRTLAVFELLALSQFDKMDRKRKLAAGGATH
jgi:hypothetical protein